MRIMAKNHTATKEQRQAGAWRKRGTKSVGGGMLALTSAAVAAAMLATPAALAGEGTARYYSSKQPYVAPASTSYSAIPSRYHLAYTESVARHGSRGLSSYKYDALLALMAQSAAENNYAGFVSPEVGKEFINNVNAITAANVGNGYGMLSGQGAIQHQGIGERIYQRDADLFANAAKQGLRVSYQSSGEPRATESGENFKLGFDQASNGLLANAVVAPNNPADNNSGKNFDKNTTTLYFHKTDNPDGTQKTGEAKERAERYQQFVANDGGIAEAEENVTNDPSMTTASHNLLSQIFTDDFLASIGKEEGQRIWYNTADGTKKGAANCAAGADPAKDANACGDAKKKIASEQDAAMDLYNLYIIAADMEQENTGSHTFNFDQYFQGQHAQEAKTFAWSLDAEDFYEKGPGRAGQDETYRIAQPLLDDFFNAIDTRERAGTAATFRFAHAETIIPFAALLKLPGSQQQASELYTYENNPWRGESVTPMAANVQWDVVVRDGTDVSGQPYQPLVRMLYNEKEIGFNDSCTPIADGSTWYKESELKSCLNGKGTTVDARLTDEEGQPETPGHESTPDDSQKAPGANDANGQRKHPVKSSANGGDAVKLAKTGSNVTPAIVATVVMVSSAIFGGSYARRSRRKA